MEIELSELRAIISKEIDNLERMGYDPIEIPVDYYWNIPKELLYDPYKEPHTFDVGQLSFDWQELKNTLRGKRDPLTYHFVWLAAILRAIGEHTVG